MPNLTACEVSSKYLVGNDQNVPFFKEKNGQNIHFLDYNVTMPLV